MLCTTVDHSGSSPVLNVSLGHSVLMALAKCYHDLLIKPAYQDLIDAYLKGAAFTYSTVHYPYMRLLNSILRDLLDDNLSAEEKNSVVSPLSPNGVADPNTFFFNPSMNFTREVTSGSGRIDEKAIEMIFSTVGWAFRVIVRSRVSCFMDYICFISNYCYVHWCNTPIGMLLLTVQFNLA